MAAKTRMRRFCLLLSYCGKNYLGMQRNPGTNTIEECLLKALKETGLISEESYSRPQLMYFQRSARTDKSVSAIRQVISLKVPDSITTRIKDVNALLPEDIRLMGCKRVTQAFDAKNFCDARTYSYLMPSFTLCPISELTREDYRISEDVLKLFNSTLEGFVGTHVFHNFTSGKNYKDDSAVRVIRYMYCSEPFFPMDQKEIEFVLVRVKGQSFMMHQIRKMIGLAIAVVKGFATEDHIKRSMEEPYMDIPKAPGLGLMLEETHFDRYNRKFGGDGHHEPLEWNNESAEIDKFKNKYIYPVVVETEMKEKTMFNWLTTLSLHSYGDNKTPLSSLKPYIYKGDSNRENKEAEDEEDGGGKSTECSTVESNRKRLKVDKVMDKTSPETNDDETVQADQDPSDKAKISNS